MAIAFFNGARLDCEGRRALFNNINALPTCYEIASGRMGDGEGGGAQVSMRAVPQDGGGSGSGGAINKRPREVNKIDITICYIPCLFVLR